MSGISSSGTAGRRIVAALTGTVVALALPATVGLGAAVAADRDRDDDGIPNRWESTHGMNPDRAADALRDFDKDGLANLREYRLRSLIRDEDTDNDGHDDGDEVTDGFASTKVKVADTDDDGVLDGDEDADGDDVDNEDEDDARETCARDDDDRDDDHVADEDENELGLEARAADSDDDGVLDGDEDSDEDGEANEDDDDDDLDRCDGDHDGDGESDEDDEDLFGTIVSFDEATGVLTLESTTGAQLSLEVTDETEIEIEGDAAPGTTAQSDSSDGEESDSSDGEDGDEQEDREGTTADLVPGAQVAEIEIDEDDGTLEEIELYA